MFHTIVFWNFNPLSMNDVCVVRFYDYLCLINCRQALLVGQATAMLEGAESPGPHLS